MFGFLFTGASALPSYSSTLDSFVVINADGGCNPLNGLYQATWASSGDVSVSEVALEYSFDNVTFLPIASGLLASDSYSGDLSGEPGFTSLASTYFRCTLTIGPINQTNSPMDLSPPYAC